MPEQASGAAVATGREQRRARRYLTLATAKIAIPGDAIDCAVLNVSAGGACLLVCDVAAVPDAFDLLVDPGRIKVRCTIAWRGRHHVGVSFVPTGGEPLPSPDAWPPLVPLAET
ncbi:PilZ domain-containing protein [Rhodoplanes sp. TEM]|uniref:PilZ domain-containing protein n=1 Tax=Rhodoplanes tepidamans TaxID=200616 RepID=A0ABT5J4U9_RHOTP|nr:MULTISPECIES: PilZ domain-containing protein [Rhodoplanes]MDC7784548.1 PilZ domain-containing protein [Rhodoplanes tepidamans]MDC7984455.1 PilZ domain-containing protein [Rhodoplanes sp. TEM]MDQ0355776.1 hypothetical protein [Rhodoplanes tepidamans]